MEFADQILFAAQPVILRQAELHREIADFLPGLELGDETKDPVLFNATAELRPRAPDFTLYSRTMFDGDPTANAGPVERHLRLDSRMRETGALSNIDESQLPFRE